MDEVPDSALVVLLVGAVLALLLCGFLEGSDIEAHAEWMAETEASGAAVAW